MSVIKPFAYTKGCGTITTGLTLQTRPVYPVTKTPDLNRRLQPVGRFGKVSKVSKERLARTTLGELPCRTQDGSKHENQDRTVRRIYESTHLGGGFVCLSFTPRVGLLNILRISLLPQNFGSTQDGPSRVSIGIFYKPEPDDKV